MKKLSLLILGTLVTGNIFGMQQEQPNPIEQMQQAGHQMRRVQVVDPVTGRARIIEAAAIQPGEVNPLIQQLLEQGVNQVVLQPPAAQADVWTRPGLVRPQQVQPLTAERTRELWDRGFAAGQRAQQAPEIVAARPANPAERAIWEAGYTRGIQPAEQQEPIHRTVFITRGEQQYEPMELESKYPILPE